MVSLSLIVIKIFTMSEIDEIYNYELKRTYKVFDYTEDKDGEYPQDWFTKNKGQKPLLNIPYRDFPIEEGLKFIIKQNVSQFPPKVIKSILFYYAKKYNESVR